MLLFVVFTNLHLTFITLFHNPYPLNESLSSIVLQLYIATDSVESSRRRMHVQLCCHLRRTNFLQFSG